MRHHLSTSSCCHAQVVVASHSWGDNVFRNFMLWATEEDNDWVEKHIAAYVNIAGPTLGVAKSMTSLLSGTLPCSMGLLNLDAASARDQEMPAACNYPHTVHWWIVACRPLTYQRRVLQLPCVSILQQLHCHQGCLQQLRPAQ